MKSLLIKGAASHGAVVAEAALFRWKVAGFVDKANINPVTAAFAPLIGHLEMLPELLTAHKAQDLFVAIGDNFQRSEVVRQARAIAPHVRFPAIVHPSATVCQGAEIGEGAIVCAGAVIGTGAKVGAFAIVNTRASLDHHAVLGDYASLAPAAAAGGNAQIGEGTAIGMGTMIHHGVHVGPWAVVGSCSLVIREIEGGVVAFGQPAKVVRFRQPSDRYL